MKIPVILILAIMLCATSEAQAAISMSIDRDRLDFRAGNPGDTLDLSDQGAYHNEITCTSDNNKTWYLKQHIVRSFTSGSNTIPNDNFQWEVVDIDAGKGTVYGDKNVPHPFTSPPAGIIYTSADTDNTGTPVRIRFRYHLTIPRNQVAGAYDASVRFTMNEIL